MISKGLSESVYRKRTDNTTAKRKVPNDKQRSTKYTLKTTNRLTRTPLGSEGELRCSGKQAVPALLVALLLHYFTITFFNESFSQMLFL
jgi:hypothetical protein